MKCGGRFGAFRKISKQRTAVEPRESFDQTFSKVCAGGGREALLALRRGRNFPYAFSFCKLFLLRLHRQKKKRIRNFRKHSVRSKYKKTHSVFHPLSRFATAPPTSRCPPAVGLFSSSAANRFALLQDFKPPHKSGVSFHALLR